MKDIVVLLHNVRSLHNVGSIFRTADGAGVCKIFLCGITPTPIDVFGVPREQLTKVSLGAEEFIPWQKARSTTNIMRKFKKEGYYIVAVEQDKKSLPYRKVSKSVQAKQKVVIVMGDEVRGVPSSVLSLADVIAEIPMRGKKESLNVSVSFGIIAYSILEN